MFYRFVKVLMTVALRLFYRRIYVTGLENIADTGPAIIIPNHNSSLMDAALLGILIRRPLYFFARGDVFINRLVSAILYRFHMLPVHPHDGGRKTLSDNAESFSKAEEILLKGGIIIFFPEGSSHVDKQILPLRKGVFRLAFKTSAQRNYELNIPLIPAGITYSHPTKWRSDVMVHLGTPIQLDAHINGFRQNAPATLLALTKQAHKSLTQLAPDVADPTLNSLTIGGAEIASNEFDFYTPRWKQATRKRLDREKLVYARLTKLSSAEQLTLGNVHHRYRELLAQFRLNDKTVSSQFGFQVGFYFLLLIGLPFFLVGYLLNFLPVFIARQIVVHKVTRDDFFSWIFVTSSLVLYLLWLLLVVVITAFIDLRYAILALFMIPLTGVFTLIYMRYWFAATQYGRLQRAKKGSPEAFDEMVTCRKRLLHAVS